MKKILATGISAIALMVSAVPAYAVTNLGSFALSDSDASSDFLGVILLSPEVRAAGDYAITYTFGFDTAGVGAGNLSANLVVGANTLLDSISLNGTPWSVAADQRSAFLDSGPVLGLPSLNQVLVNFKVVSGTASSAFQGSVSATGVPEASTWAMMLVGFGLIGFGMRRRRDKVTTRVRFAMS